MRWPDEQIAATRAQAPREFAALTGLASFCAVLGWYYAPSMHLALLGWLCAIGCVAGAGWYLLVSRPGSAVLRVHVRQRLVLGVLWGGFAFFVDTQWPDIVVALLNTALAVVAVGMLRTRAIHPVSYAALVAPALLLFGGGISTLGSDLSAALALIDLAMAAMLVTEEPEPMTAWMVLTVPMARVATVVMVVTVPMAAVLVMMAVVKRLVYGMLQICGL